MLLFVYQAGVKQPFEETAKIGCLVDLALFLKGEHHTGKLSEIFKVMSFWGGGPSCRFHCIASI